MRKKKIVRIPILRPPLLKFHSENEKMVPCRNIFCDRMAYESEGGYCYIHQCKLNYVEKEIKKDE